MASLVYCSGDIHGWRHCLPRSEFIMQDTQQSTWRSSTWLFSRPYTAAFQISTTIAILGPPTFQQHEIVDEVRDQKCSIFSTPTFHATVKGWEVSFRAESWSLAGKWSRYFDGTANRE